VGLRFEYRELTGIDEAQVMLIIPEGKLRVGRDRLKTVAFPQSSGLDDQISSAARAADRTARVTVFTGKAADGGGSWGLAEDLDSDEVDQLARILVRSQILTYRRLFLAGVCMHIRLDMGPREQLAFRRANYEVRREIEKALPTSGSARELAELDVWLLKNFVFFFAVSVDRLLESTLGENSHSVRVRMKRAARRRESLSDAALAEAAA
jgi:hypothetical protein